jgi:hypothetical protein
VKSAKSVVEKIPVGRSQKIREIDFPFGCRAKPS